MVSVEKAIQILIVDDSEADVFIYTRAIRASGLDVEIKSAGDGHAALDLLRKGVCPDFIFLDINMPGMDGWEFLDAYHELRDELELDCAVLVVTTSLNPDDRTRAAENPEVQEFRSKPIRADDLRQIFEQWLQSRGRAA